MKKLVLLLLTLKEVTENFSYTNIIIYGDKYRKKEQPWGCSLGFLRHDPY